MAKHQFACRTVLSASLISIGLVGCGGGSDSSTSSVVPAPTQGIQTVSITSTTPAVFAGTTFGSVGTYDKIEGVAYGQIDPNDPKNQVIADIAFAPTNSSGMVEYTAPFYILKPSTLSKGNGKVFYEAPNRGGKQYGSFNQSGGGNDPGMEFLQH